MTIENKLTWEAIFSDEKKYHDYEFPKVSIIVPTLNCSEKISLTIESVLSQSYPDFELIIIDAGSTDRTLEVIKFHKDPRLKVYIAYGYNRYEMLNKGIKQSNGLYINFLFPGDFYIHNKTLYNMMEIAIDNNKPELVYCGTSIREAHADSKILLRALTPNLLRHGQQPTSLQSCWFLTETVKDLGDFDTTYTIRGGFDLMCKFILKPNLRAVLSKRILTDYDLRNVTLSMVRAHFTETMRTVYKHFGLKAAIQWLFYQKDFNRIIKLWLRTVKAAFVGS